MSTSAHQQAAIRRLEALFRDVKLEQLQHNHPELIKHEIKIDKCCEIHGRHAKENCWSRRGSLGNVHQTRKDSLGRHHEPHRVYSATSPNGRGSLGPSSSRKELHPSTFPSTLRKNPLGSSMSAINHTKRGDTFPNTIGGSALRRDPIGRSMGCLRKDTMSNYNSPLRRDYVAKSMTNLQRPATTRRDAAPNLASLFTSPADASRASLRAGLSSSKPGELKARSCSNGNLKSCLAGSSGNLRGNLNVTLSGGPTSASAIMKKDCKSAIPPAGRKGSAYDRRRLSTDSLENLKRNSWDPDRRGSSGSSGGWDDPIWEEGSFDNGADQKRDNPHSAQTNGRE
ncbi:uncharacterized protein LOC109504121 [Harpegnathos saltator]|uniref:uncharacterized protein LOC109504121 n=1 Tax=Harpegnathos saltator TaxID=610380 RepID=UPI000948F411|nr:uncharacterized protein LOC109504121 [Harpegnathos saltator]